MPEDVDQLEHFGDDPMDSDYEPDDDSDGGDDDTLGPYDPEEADLGDENDNVEIDITDQVDDEPAAVEIPGVAPGENTEVIEANEPPEDVVEEENTGVVDDRIDEEENRDDLTGVEAGNEETGDAPTHGDHVQEDASEILTQGQIQELMDRRYGARPVGRGLRPRRPRQYRDGQFQLGGKTFFTMDSELIREAKVLTEQMQEVSLATEQMFLEKGLKAFGEEGTKAVLKELAQLHDRKVGEPIHPNMLTREEKQRALRYLMYLKRKRCGRVKARGCADGRKQRKWKSKEDTSSPTPRLEALFLSCIIDSNEDRVVKTLDIPGAFMQADIDEIIHVMLEGEMARLFATLCPETYNRHVTYENGRPVLYLKLNKALYGTLQAALLFYNDLRDFLVEELGFAVNPYDECVANKMIDGKQCTVLWHVDDLKISHVSEAVVDSIISALNSKYGKTDKLTETSGKIHPFLGMSLDFSEKGKFSVKMIDYVNSIITGCPEEFGEGTAVTPATNNLFQTDPNDKKLDPEQADRFHTEVARLLFLCKRARPDIHTAVTFLTTRVKSPGVHDWKKLGRIIRYLRGTAGLYLTLETDNLKQMLWYVDASFAVHGDMRSHTGMSMTMGKGAIYSNSVHQKINTRSSTEAELVGVDDSMTMLLWMQNFMEGQGYPIEECVMYQDNQSAILLERNGKRSSTKRTRHLDVRYYFVTDNIKKKKLKVQYCPTEKMWGDMHTKPLQGTLFRTMRKWHLNCVLDDFEDPANTKTGSPQECVGTQCDQGPMTSRKTNVPVTKSVRFEQTPQLP